MNRQDAKIAKKFLNAHLRGKPCRVKAEDWFYPGGIGKNLGALGVLAAQTKLHFLSHTKQTGTP
jgi:hypothetical protein